MFIEQITVCGNLSLILLVIISKKLKTELQELESSWQYLKFLFVIKHEYAENKYVVQKLLFKTISNNNQSPLFDPFE